jgi:TonB family protein
MNIWLNFCGNLALHCSAMTYKRLAVLLAFCLVSLAAQAESVKDSLDRQYKKQLLALRFPFSRGDLKFDSAGRPLHSPPGPWLNYGGIFVEKMSLSADTLRLQGHWAVLGRKNKKGEVEVIPLGKSVTVEIHLEKPLQSLDDAQALLDHVFYLQDDGHRHSVPEIRRADENGLDEPQFEVGKDETKPPSAVYTPEPEFSEKARRAKYQGTVVLSIVVDRKGNISRVSLVRALGMGLDQNAMEGVTRWRFDPATRNGQPVAVKMNIEVSFNLY